MSEPDKKPKDFSDPTFNMSDLIEQTTGGGLRWLVDGKLDPEPIIGVPETIQYGTGGMMDLALDPDYALNGWVYIGYVHPLGSSGRTDQRPAMTRIIRGRIVDYRWVQQELLFSVPDELYFVNRGRWGCRLLFDKAGYLYFTIGDIRENADVQRLDKPAGKTYRINPDGSVTQRNLGRKDNQYSSLDFRLSRQFAVGGVMLEPALDVAHRVAGGDLSHVAQVQGRDETARLMQSLSHMTQGLARMVGEVRGASETIGANVRSLAEGNRRPRQTVAESPRSSLRLQFRP